jgi:thiol-disulfide isomerase/thioredoxin
MRGRLLLSGLLMAAASAAVAEPIMPPHLAVANQLEFRDYLEAPDHRAFAIAPGGAWGWSAGEPSGEAAGDKALADCAGNTEQRCVLYGVDGRVVFDVRGWTQLWGPYATARDAAGRRSGTARGERFPNLLLKDGRGRPVTLAAFAGKVVFLHFWGTWCPPCRREFPEIARLQADVARRADVAFVLVQVREDFATAREWLKRQGLSLPLYDSGVHNDMDAELHLADGSVIADRKLATRFPTTYVLDKRGIVVFSHVGPVADWQQYGVFLRDAADRSGR